MFIQLQTMATGEGFDLDEVYIVCTIMILCNIPFLNRALSAFGLCSNCLTFIYSCFEKVFEKRKNKCKWQTQNELWLVSRSRISGKSKETSLLGRGIMGLMNLFFYLTY